MDENKSILGYVSIVPKGPYSPTATYNRLNVVSYNGGSYMLTVDTPTTGVTPADGSTWMQLAAAGEGVTVSAQETAYVASTQGDTPPETGWLTTIPDVSAGSYLWSRITTTFSDGSSFNFYMVTRFGIDGSGAVSSVNGISPDATGNVQLTLGSIATVDNTPTINSQNLVTSGGVYARINAILSSTQVKIQSGTITLPAASWTGSGPYTQPVTVAGSTAQSQINIQGDQTAIAAANSGGFAVLVSNTGGTLTAYAIGTKPTVDLTLQITDVNLSGAIGTVVGAPLGGGAPDGSITIPKLASTTKSYIDAFNLLDNSNFANPVNQNGETAYTASGISIDRWKKVTNCTVNVEEGYVSISAPETGDDYQSFYQYINPKHISAGEKYTLAVKTDSGDIYSIAVTAPALVAGQSATVYTEQTGIGELGFFSLGLDTDGLYQFRIRVYKGKSLSLVWAALYEGEFTVDTLPKYQPKSFAAELAECLWYRFVIRGPAVGFGYTGSSTGVFASFPLHGPMRLISPTVTTTTTLGIYAAGVNYVNYEITGAANIRGSVLRCELTRESSTFPPTKEPIVVTTSGNITIDAELK